MTSQQAQSVQQLQRTWLDTQRRTAQIVEESLVALLAISRDSAPSTSSQPQRLRQWIAVASLHSITDSKEAAKLDSIDALTALLEVGVQAAEPEHFDPSSSTGPSLSTTGKTLLVAQNTLSALRKAGVTAHTADSSASSDALDQEEEEDDEEAAWFDTKQATPSPSPAAQAAPSLMLPSLCTALAHPVKLAILLAPYADRLVVWLNAVSKPIYTHSVWPARLQIVRNILSRIAIVEDGDGQEHALQQLERLRLMPFRKGAGESIDIWTELCEKEDPSPLSPLANAFGSDASDDLTDVEYEAANIASTAEWYLSTATHLSTTYDAPTLASALCRFAQRQVSPDSSRLQTERLRQLMEDLDASRVLEDGSNQANFDHEGSETFLRRLRDDPISALALPLAESKAGWSLEALSSALATVCAKLHATPQATARDICWRVAQTQGNLVSLPALLRAGQVSDDDRSIIAISVLLASRRKEGTEQLKELLRGAADRQGDSNSLLSRLRGLYPTQMDGKKAVDGSLPSAREVFRMCEASEGTALAALQSRCRLYFATLEENQQIASALASLAPWQVILCESEQDSSQVFGQVVRSMTPPDSPQTYVDLHSAVEQSHNLRLLLEHLKPTFIAGASINAVLACQAPESQILSAVTAIARCLPASEVEAVLIAAARNALDRAQGGRNAVPDLKKARQSLLAAPNQKSPLVTASLSFLNAVMRLMQLTQPLSSVLHRSMLMTPLEIRFSTKKLDVIRKWLDAGSDSAWKREDDVIETALGLCAGYNTDTLGANDDHSSQEVTQAPKVPSRNVIKIHVYAMLADAALGNNDLARSQEYASKMVHAMHDLSKRASKSQRSVAAHTGGSATADVHTELEEAREVVWTTLFSMSKHPHSGGGGSLEAVRRQWLAEAIAYAPQQRVADLLKRWRGLNNEQVDRQENDVKTLFDSCRKTQEQNGFSSTVLPASNDSGTGSGVFSLAALAVNRSHWPIVGGVKSGSMDPASAFASGGLGVGGVGGALSSLAGSLGENYYGSRLTGLWGSNLPAAAHPAPAIEAQTAPRSSKDEATQQRRASGSREPRSAASLFDDFDGRPRHSDGAPMPKGSGQRSQSPSSYGNYLDPAERAARAARGFLSGWRGGTASSPLAGMSELAGAPRPNAAGGPHPPGGSGWAALGSRGMGWLMGEEEGEVGHQTQRTATGVPMRQQQSHER